MGIGLEAVRTGRYIQGMSPLLAQLAALCRAHPLEPKLVFVPSAQIGQALGTALAGQGSGWANLRLVTPAAWAAHWAGPGLAAAGWRPLGMDEEFFLLWELLGARGRTRALGSADRPSTSLVRGLAQTLRTLRLNGINPEALRTLDPENQRLEALAELLEEYPQALAQRHRYDQARLYTEATGLKGAASGVFALCSEVMLPELASRFVRHCLGSGGQLLGWETALAKPPDHSAGARFANLPRLSAPASPAEPRPPVRVWQAAGIEAEFRAMLRDVLRRGLPLDQVELAYSAEQPYLDLIHSLAGELGIKIYAVQGFAPHLSQVGQALTGFYRWIGSGRDPGELAELCRAGLLKGLPEAGPVYRLAPFLRYQRQGVGAEGEHDEMISADEPTQPEDMLRAQVFSKSLGGLVPTGSEVSLQSLAEAGIRFLETRVPLSREHERQWAGVMAERLRALGAVEVVDHPGRLAQRLLDRLGTHLFPGTDAGEGALWVGPVEEAGYTGRKYLYIIGMDEGSFPGRPTVDPLLADAERQQLGLPLQRQRPATLAWQLSRVLAGHRGETTLVYSHCALQDGREQAPAPLVQQAAEHAAMAEIPLVVADPALALDRGETMLAACRGAGSALWVQGLFPWLAAGEHACQQREQTGLGRFSGWLGRATPELGFSRLHSASALEALMRCPYSYFLGYVLDLEGPPERGEDPGRWLSPAEFGSALHRLFFRFMAALRERGERPSAAQHGPLLEQLLRELVGELRSQIPVRHEAALRADLRRLERSARIFLRAESRRRDAEPVDFELSFGQGEHGGAYFRDGVVLNLSEQLQLRLQGRIDRVDRTGEGYQIWDYKTGSSTPYEGEDLLRGGIHLQWALYGYALTQILNQREPGARVLGAGYYFISAREHGRRLSAPPPDPGEVARHLGPVVGMAAQGAFFPIQRERQCPHCDFAPLCGGEGRLANEVDPEATPPDLPGLAPLLRQWADG